MKTEFRCWDKFNENMTFSKILCDFFDDYQRLADGGNSPILMQWTGLRDKNGAKIFEGDIVRHTTDFNTDVHGNYVDYEVVFRNGCWMASYWKSEKESRLPRGFTCGLIVEIFQEDMSKEFYFTDNDQYSKIDALVIVGNIHSEN